METNQMLIYQSDDGKIRIETKLENETVWLTIDQLSELFQKSRSTINEHILNVFKEGELEEELVKGKIGISDFLHNELSEVDMHFINAIENTVKAIEKK